MKTAVSAMSPRWAQYGVGLTIAVMLMFAAWTPLQQTFFWLSSLPEVGNAFQDPVSGRQDAWISLFSVMLLSPLAFTVFVWALAIVYALPAGYMLPIGRRIGLPEWVSSLFVMVLSIGTVYELSDLWAPPVLRALGILARAVLIILS
jgi:hypothetical protein